MTIDLPPALATLTLRPLFAMQLSVGPLQQIGGPADRHQRVGPITSGRFEGERLAGRVLDGGSDWQSVSRDGSTRLDGRLALETDAGDVIGMTFAGLRHGSAETISRLSAGESVDPADYYFRISASFTTESRSLRWLARTLAVGSGHRRRDGPVYNLFEVL